MNDLDPRHPGSHPMVSIRQLSFIAVVLLQASVPVLGYRPFLMNDAGVVGRGVLQLEEGWDYGVSHDTRRDHFLLTSLAYGALAPLELAATFPYQWHREASGHTSGWADLAASAKLQLLPETDNRPAVTLNGFYKSASGSLPVLGTGETDWGSLLLVSKSISRWSVHANLGHGWIGQVSGRPLDVWLGGVGVDYEVVKSWHAIAEVNGVRYPASSNLENSVIGALGGWVQLNKWVALDLFIRRGWETSVPRWTPGAGLTLVWK